MGTIVRFKFQHPAASSARMTANHIGFLRSMIRATADLLGRERDDVYRDVAGFAGVSNLDDLAIDDLGRVTLFLHTLQIKALGLDK